MIVEAGSCHDGDLGKAMRLIDEAKAAGADCVKFQYWSSAERLAERRRAPAYLDIYAKYQVPTWWLSLLKQRCDRMGLEFMCTTYLPEDIETVTPFVKRFKISSFEAPDVLFVEAHRRYDREILVSVGMNGPIWAGVRSLHCVSAYPAPIGDLNLAAIRYRGLSGFSDHSGDPRVGGWAVAAGAQIIEVHAKLDETDKANPDGGPHAFNPWALEQYIRWIRDADSAIGDGMPGLQPSELAMSAYQVR